MGSKQQTAQSLACQSTCKRSPEARLLTHDYGFSLTGLGVSLCFRNVVDIFNLEVWGQVHHCLIAINFQVSLFSFSNFSIGQTGHLQIFRAVNGGRAR
jgi:hypothetical protein